MPEPDSKLPSEREWERSELLEPRLCPALPTLVSDGGGLPFPLAALEGAPGVLDPSDPAVAALLGHLTTPVAPKRAVSRPWRAPLAPPGDPAMLEGWRLLSRTDSEALFGLGRPPALRTIAVRKDRRRESWSYAGTSVAEPLRAARERIRASSWRLDPTREVGTAERELRILVREQTFASGQLADGRIQAPDLYIDADRLVLTVFVTPRPGYQTTARGRETPARVALPEPVGTRTLLDGGLVTV